jgi:hypothetical protein
VVGAGAGPGKERKVRSDVLYLFREMRFRDSEEDFVIASVYWIKDTTKLGT